MGKTGLDKLNSLLASNSKKSEDAIVTDEESSDGVEKVEVKEYVLKIVDDDFEITYEDMLDEIGLFLRHFSYVKDMHLKLVRDERKSLIYQGSLNCLYAILYHNKRTKFPRTSFCRVISNLPEDSLLHRYFKEEIERR